MTRKYFLITPQLTVREILNYHRYRQLYDNQVYFK